VRGLFAVGVAIAVAGCANSRPGMNLACESDQQCLDPAQPYCTNGTCGACGAPSTCTMALPRCSPDTLTCGGCVGDIDCALYATTPHCGHAGACVGCTVSAECANPTPTCDQTTDTCRACKTDDECASAVCDLASGSCVDAADILYASPTTTSSTSCTQSSPCEVDTAISQVDFTRTIVRMLPGTYISPITISGTTTMTIVATGATLETTMVATGLNVVAGASVAIRGLTMNIDGQAIYCDGMTGESTLSLTDVNVVSAGYGIASAHCNLTLQHVSLPTGINPAGSHTTLVMDRTNTYIRADDGNASDGGGISITATNSILGSLDFSHAGGISIHASFDTFTSAEVCMETNPGTPTVLFDNDIFYDPTAKDAISGTACTFDHAVAFPLPDLIGTATIAMDPRLVNPSAGDYHLQAGSPAIDAASSAVSDDHDFDDVTRPQGAAPDIGAFEYKP